MRVVNKEIILEALPLFARLSSAEISLIKEKSFLAEYCKSEVIYEELSGPSGFYCIISGRVVIYTRNPAQGNSVLEYLHRGKYFGIISLLTGEPHSVTAQAINDSLILVIKKEDFDFILRRVPAIAVDLSQTLSRRLKNKGIHQKTIFESMIISAYSSYTQAGKTIYALNLGLGLRQETHKSVIILEICQEEKTHSLPERLGLRAEDKVIDLSGPAMEAQINREFVLRPASGIDLLCFHYRPDDDSCAEKLLGIISLMVNDYHYLILDLPSLMDRQIFKVLNQSDLIHLLTSPDEVDLKRTRHLIERLKEEFNFQPDKIKVIVNEYKLSKFSVEQEKEIVGMPIFATLPKIAFQAPDALILENPGCEYARAVRRVSRQLGEMQVGLVLGVGVGYGFCHIGVLKVIEEEKIPIDVIAGASIGAVIASLWATGRSSAEILEITKEFRQPQHIWGLIDLTIPFLGFVKGNKLRRFLKKHFGNRTFHDLRLPLKIIASDVKRKEPRVFESGLLADAIMASCSMPGVFAPFKFKEELLFDGGVIHPLPTEPLANMGVKKIIAVNVTPSREDIARQYEKIKKEMAAAPGNKKRNFIKTNILDIIFSSIEALQSEVAKKEEGLADVVLHPDTSGLYWLELHKAAEFARRGEDEARRNLGKIRQLVNE
ncbi:MAG: patatin-like phospholipase family protein [Candidatus Omnitrophota bacterium]|nr:patatin-like phospholipase family protein [Candidatus Omnitrophota bacterium]